MVKCWKRFNCRPQSAPTYRTNVVLQPDQPQDNSHQPPAISQRPTANSQQPPLPSTPHHVRTPAPKVFLDPISLEIMKDPVMCGTSLGTNYVTRYCTNDDCLVPMLVVYVRQSSAREYARSTL